MGEGLPPLLLTALRFAIAAIAMLPLFWREPEGLPGLPALVIYSLLGLSQAAFFGSMFWAAHRMSALSMAVLCVSVPFLTYCFGLAFRVERASAPLLGILASWHLGILASWHLGILASWRLEHAVPWVWLGRKAAVSLPACIWALPKWCSCLDVWALPSTLC
nr:EamA family transporter [Halomonas aerodenitrificans]